MKTKIIGLLIVIIFLTTLINLKAEHAYSEKTVVIDLSTNMICTMSMNIIKKALNKVKGVENIEFDVDSKMVTVTFDDSLTNLSKLEKVLTDAGFNANDKDADLMAYESLPKCCKIR